MEELLTAVKAPPADRWLKYLLARLLSDIYVLGYSCFASCKARIRNLGTTIHRCHLAVQLQILTADYLGCPLWEPLIVFT